MTFEEYRKIINGLSLDVRILARELYGASDALGGNTALSTIDRMTARLREQLVSETQAKEAGE